MFLSDFSVSSYFLLNLIICSEWTDEIYTVVQVEQSLGVCYYRVADEDGDALKKSFYNEQLNLVASSYAFSEDDE